MAAALIWFVTVVLLAAGLLTTPLEGSGAPTLIQLSAVVLAVLSLATVGAILVRRLPHNLIGWLLLVSGLIIAFTIGAGGVAYYGLSSDPPSVPGAIWIGLLSQLTWTPFIVLLGLYLPLLYPSGHLPSKRWRPVAAIGVIAIVLSGAQNAFSPFAPGAFPTPVLNPLAVGEPASGVLSVLGGVSALIGIVALPCVAASLVLRYRHAPGVERQQLRWLAGVIAIVVPSLVVAIVTGGETSGIGLDISNLAWALTLVGFALIPVAIGIAILRYRLYEIDVVIRRTLVYGVLAALLAATYGGSVLLLSALLAPITSGNSLAVAGSTLVVAALFSPVRSRIQSLVERRFYRSRYDAEREVNDLSLRLRNEVELDGVTSAVIGTIGRTLAPTSASIWLRK